MLSTHVYSDIYMWHDTGIYTQNTYIFNSEHTYNDINTCITSRRSYTYMHSDIHIINTLIPNTHRE